MAKRGLSCGPAFFRSLFESHQGHQIVVIFRGRRPPTQDRFLTHFICLALGLLFMKQMERNCIISRVERLDSWISIDMLPGVSGSSLLCTLDSIREAWPP